MDNRLTFSSEDQELPWILKWDFLNTISNFLLTVQEAIKTLMCLTW